MLENDGCYLRLTCDYCGKEIDEVVSLANWFYRGYEETYNGYLSNSSDFESGDFCSKKCKKRYNKPSKYSLGAEIDYDVFADNQRNGQGVLDYFTSLTGSLYE